MISSLFYFRTIAWFLIFIWIAAFSAFLINVNTSRNTFHESQINLSSGKWLIADGTNRPNCTFQNKPIVSCLKNNFDWIEINVPFDRIPFKKFTSVWYQANFTVTAADQGALDSPTIYLGYIKGPYTAYLNNQKVSSGTKNYNVAYVTLPQNYLILGNNTLLIEVKHTENLNAGIVHPEEIGIANFSIVENKINKGRQFITVQGALLTILRAILCISSLLLFIFSSHRRELFFLSAAIFLSSAVPLRTALILVYDLDPLLTAKVIGTCVILSKILVGAYVLSFFRVNVKHVAGYLGLMLLAHAVFMYNIIIGKDIWQSSLPLDQWSSVAYWILTLFELSVTAIGIYYLRTRLNLKSRVRLSTMLFLSLSFTPMLQIFLFNDILLGPTKKFVPPREMTDLAFLIMIFSIPIIEAIQSEKTKQKIETTVRSLIDRILKSYQNSYRDYMNWIIEEARTFLSAKRASLILFDPIKQKHIVSFVSGLTPKEALGKEVSPNSISDFALKYGNTIAVPNVKYDNMLKKLTAGSGYSTHSFIAAPLEVEGNQFGIIFVSDPDRKRNWFNHTEKYYIELFANKISAEILKFKQMEEIKSKNKEMELIISESDRSLKVLSTTVDDHFHEEDSDTSGHNGAVLSFAEGILSAALELKIVNQIQLAEFESSTDFLSLSFRQRLKRIATMHDIGKREVPAAILCKRGKLDFPTEVQIMQGHALQTYYIIQGGKYQLRFSRGLELEKIQMERFGSLNKCCVNYLDKDGRARMQTVPPNFSNLIEHYPDEYDGIVASAHQEFFNGNGYPFALKGSEIPIIGRILCIADSMAVMKLREVYEPAKSWEWVYFELEACSGTQFDPILVKAAQHYWMNKMPSAAKQNVLVVIGKGLKGKEAQDSGLIEKFTKPSKTAA